MKLIYCIVYHRGFYYKEPLLVWGIPQNKARVEHFTCGIQKTSEPISDTDGIHKETLKDKWNTKKTRKSGRKSKNK